MREHPYLTSPHSKKYNRVAGELGASEKFHRENKPAEGVPRNAGHKITSLIADHITREYRVRYFDMCTTYYDRSCIMTAVHNSLIREELKFSWNQIGCFNWSENAIRNPDDKLHTLQGKTHLKNGSWATSFVLLKRHSWICSGCNLLQLLF